MGLQTSQHEPDALLMIPSACLLSLAVEHLSRAKMDRSVSCSQYFFVSGEQLNELCQQENKMSANKRQQKMKSAAGGVLGFCETKKMIYLFS